MAVATRIPVIKVPIAEGIHRLETFVRRMERRYECKSECALEDVRGGRMRETAEVARCLISYRALQRLRGYVGAEIGSDTTTIASSTNGASTRWSPKD